MVDKLEKLSDKTISIRDYLRVVFSHKILFVVMPIAILIPVYLSLQMQTPTFRATVRMYVKAQKITRSDFYTGLGSFNLLMDHTEQVMSNIVLARVVNALKLYEIPLDDELRFASRIKKAWLKSKFIERNIKPEELTPDQKFDAAMERLSNNVSAIADQRSSFFEIIVEDFDGARAAAIANSLSRSYVIFDLEGQAEELKLKYGEKHSAVIQLKDYIAEMSKTLDGAVIPDASALGPASVKIVRQAIGSEKVRSVNKPLLLIMAFISSIIISIIFAYLLEYFDHTIKSPEDIEKYLDIPFIYSIPGRKLTDKLLISDSDTVNRVYYKSVVSLAEQVRLLMKDKNLNTLSIAGAEESKDTAVVIANIGMYLAEKIGYKVLIIDANLRSSFFSNIFDFASITGLTDVLEGKILFEEAVHILGPNLHILPSGETEINPMTLLDSPQMADIINDAKNNYGIIIVHCADIKNYTDALILSSITDSTAFVINEGKVKRHVIKSALDAFKQKNIEMLGAILNKRKHVIPKLIYKIT